MLVEVLLKSRRWSRGQVFAGRQLAEALDVDCDGGQDMLEVGLGPASVAAVAHAVAVGELADGALDAGPDRVALVPGWVLLVGAVAELQGRRAAMPGAALRPEGRPRRLRHRLRELSGGASRLLCQAAWAPRNSSSASAGVFQPSVLRGGR